MEKIFIASVEGNVENEFYLLNTKYPTLKNDINEMQDLGLCKKLKTINEREVTIEFFKEIEETIKKKKVSIHIDSCYKLTKFLENKNG